MDRESIKNMYIFVTLSMNDVIVDGKFIDIRFKIPLFLPSSAYWY